MPRKIDLSEDFLFYLEFASCLDSQRSLRDVAAIIDRSPHSISDMITRLEEHFGAELLGRDREAGKAILTTAGGKLAEELKSIFTGEFCLRDDRIGIKLAHALSQNKELMAALRTALAKSDVEQNNTAGQQVGLWDCAIDAGIDMDDGKEINRLQTSEQDLILCWGLHQRLKKWSDNTHLDVRQIGGEYPLVLVSRDLAVLNECAPSTDEANSQPLLPAIHVDFETIVSKDLAILDHDKQPLDWILNRYGVIWRKAKRYHASSYHSALQLLSSGIAQLAIMPYMDHEIRNAYGAGEVFYRALPKTLLLGQERISTWIKIIAITRKKIILKDNSAKQSINKRTDQANRIVDIIDESLVKYGKVSAGLQVHNLPGNQSRFRELKYGYYLFRPSGKASGCRPSWHTETLHDFNPECIPPKAPRKNYGHIVNQYKQTFRIVKAFSMDGILCVAAQGVNLANEAIEGSGFVSVFSSCIECNFGNHQDPHPFIIAGLWSGASGLKDSMAFWSTIFSSCELNDIELQAISCKSSPVMTLSEHVLFPDYKSRGFVGDTT